MQSKKLVVFLILFVSVLIAKDFDLSSIKALKPPTLQDNYEQIKPLLTPKQQQYMEKQFKKLEDSEKQIVTFFYMTSTELGSKGIKEFNASIKKLKKYFNVEGIVVLRGFPKEKNFTEFTTESYVKGNPFILKIHPPIFREFKLKSVPAYAVSICNIGKFFSFKKCENLYLAKGNGKLEDFLEKVSERNMLFDKWYQELIQPETDVGALK